ncbi:MAG TPA: ribosomal protein S18-alanine N-acetyltransferase [Bacilli bacterium]|nr:ribosomal protein S18-alanine N-acetyltransferase [Bacilli bacterium]
MEYLNVTVRPATENDLPAILEIENLTFVSPWKEKDFRYELKENPVSNFWVIELEIESQGLKSVLGFCDYWQTFDSATICKIAVHPEMQRHDLGSAMMDEIINDCAAKQALTLTLEVRVSNSKAIAFYKKHGFREIVIKPHYYDNGEDALYMLLEIGNYGADFSN